MSTGFHDGIDQSSEYRALNVGIPEHDHAIRHVVLFKFRPGITWTDTRAAIAAQMTADHPKQIKEILSWEFGRNISDRPDAYDFALIGTFAHQAAIVRYLRDPDHIRGIRLWNEIATWVIVDFPI